MSPSSPVMPAAFLMLTSVAADGTGEQAAAAEAMDRRCFLAVLLCTDCSRRLDVRRFDVLLFVSDWSALPDGVAQALGMGVWRCSTTDFSAATAVLATAAGVSSCKTLLFMDVHDTSS